ncbi:MAG TPA: TolC family protein [Longimicrobium sp.]|nr:TolC family protein [Longimicrobium sp.]
MFTIRLRRALAALSAGAVLAASPAVAQQQPGRTITFDEAIRIALAQNGTLRLTQNSAALDSVAVRQARQQFLPDLRFSTSGAQSTGRSFSQSEGQVLTTNTRSLNSGLSSSVTVYDGGANRAELRQARLNQEAGVGDVARARQTVVFTVASNFLTLIEQGEQLRVRRETLASQQALEEQVNVYVQAGTRPIADLYQQQAAVAQAQAALVETQRAVELARVDLIQTLQLDPRGQYDFQAPAVGAASATAAPPALDTLLDRAFARRADLAARQTEVESAEEGVRIAKSTRLPTISVTAGYNTAYSTASDFGFFDQLDQRRGGSVSLGVSVPIFDRGASAAASQRASVEVENARIALENQRQQVGLEVRRALLDYQSAQAQLAAAEAQKRAADQALDATRERYQAGAGTLVELTQARATQVEAASALVAARYNLVFQRTLISYYVGELDPAAVPLGAGQ